MCDANVESRGAAPLPFRSQIRSADVNQPSRTHDVWFDDRTGSIVRATTPDAAGLAPAARFARSSDRLVGRFHTAKRDWHRQECDRSRLAIDRSNCADHVFVDAYPEAVIPWNRRRCREAPIRDGLPIVETGPHILQAHRTRPSRCPFVSVSLQPNLLLARPKRGKHLGKAFG